MRSPWPFPDFRRNAGTEEDDLLLNPLPRVVSRRAKQEDAMPDLMRLPVVDVMPQGPVGLARAPAPPRPDMRPGEIVRHAVEAAQGQAQAEVVRLQATLARMEIERETLQRELEALTRRRDAFSDWLTADAFGSTQ